MRKEFQMATSGVGLRWLPGSLDMGPPLSLLLLGDEVTFGPGFSLATTYGGWIKRATETEMEDRTLAVGNGAVPGYDALQMYLLFRKLLVMKPHLAMFCFTGGQVLERAGEGTHQGSEFLNEALRKQLFYKPNLTQAIYLGLDRVTGGSEVTGISWEVVEKRLKEDDPEEFGKIVDAIISTADEAGIPLLMSSLGLPEPHRVVLERKCRRSSVAYLDGDMALVRFDRNREQRRGTKPRTEKEKRESKLLEKEFRRGENTQYGWWIDSNLRAEAASVFLSRSYFTSRFLPTSLCHQVFGEEAVLTIAEYDLFAWRHRVLK